ncbi:low temperature requirement protein A [Streptomyces scabiei]|uniref:low temperature requirement protein A n=1 Tax=Streptomyces scabiei TaxID=1930 RepID=UPI002FEE7ADF
MDKSESGQEGGPPGTAHAVLAGSRVTTFELFFDLVYVFTLTQVTAYMAHEHSGSGVLRGVLLLALVWISWSAYAWLGNQAQADPGVVRAGMTLAMAGVFVVALTVPEACTTRRAASTGLWSWPARTSSSAVCTSSSTACSRAVTTGCCGRSRSPGPPYWAAPAS